MRVEEIIQHSQRLLELLVVYLGFPENPTFILFVLLYNYYSFFYVNWCYTPSYKELSVKNYDSLTVIDIKSKNTYYHFK